MLATDGSTCKTCGKAAAFDGAKECTNCWETESRLELYLESPKGREIVAHLLAKAEEAANDKQRS